MNGIGKETILAYSQPLWKTIRTVIIVIAVLVSLLALWYAFVQGRKASIVRAKIAQEKREYSRGRRR